ncbi:ABC transporter substrate-binding protein [Streptomyces huasconensis]|uniref:ABC transporter substrate-binding protein n=1 Tax=Streptomyces huasconensis TaxID=1854574 RepID=UPI0036F5AB57
MSQWQDGAPEAVRQAAAAADAGHPEQARELLGRALAQDRDFEPAWLWLAALVDDDGERRYCLERAVRANPESSARRQLHDLRRVEPHPPEEAIPFADPPLPPEPANRRRPWRMWRSRWALALLAAVIVAAVIFGVLRLLDTGAERVHIAVVTSTSPSGATGGQEVLQGVRFHVERVNRMGGVAGHPVELLVYDDHDEPDKARAVARDIVDDGRSAVVIGHTSSDTSIAAGEIYRAAGLPAITPTATAEKITKDNPWYFRTAFSNHSQGTFIAAYLRHVLDKSKATVISADTDYGRSLADGFDTAFTKTGEVRRTLTLDHAAPNGAKVAEAVRAVRSDGDAGAVVLALNEKPATAVLRALRTAGVRAPVVSGDILNSDRFAGVLADMSRAERPPVPFSDGFYAASPLMTDSLSGAALEWAQSFRAAHGKLPSWRAMAAQTAADAAVQALARSSMDASRPGTGERDAVRAALAAMDSPADGVQGIHGPVYFDATRSLRQPVTIAVAQDNAMVSAPLQLQPYDGDPGIDPQAEIAAGRAVDFDGQILMRQQIVSTGININEVNALDTRARTYQADFLMWFRYSGSDNVTNVEFANALDPDLGKGKPVRSLNENGMKYRLYRVTGAFKVTLDFHDFPFDKQHLTLAVRHRSLPDSRVIYTIDRRLLELDQKTALRSGSDTNVWAERLPGWTATHMTQYKNTVGSTAILGETDIGQGVSGIYYDQYTADMSIERDVAPFLVKNLLPLLLLVLVTYIPLYLPRSAGYTSVRVASGTTAILSTAVLLTTVTSSLPDVGYSVAIEWGYYAFILLSTLCVLLALVSGRLAEGNNVVGWRNLTLAAKIAYPLYCLLVILIYVWKYC